jgi:hypothetical protein
MNFLYFLIRKIHISLTDVVSSISPPWCHFSSDRHRHTATPCHTSFPLSQDELTASTLSSNNALSHRLPLRAETKTLNLQHRLRLLSSIRPTHILHCYKNTISTLVTLSITQLRFHFTSFSARAPRHQSSTCRRHSLSPLSHAHRPSA